MDMLSTEEEPPSWSDLAAWLMLKQTILMLDIYPILSQQIKSNHRKRFEPDDDGLDANTNMSTKDVYAGVASSSASRRKSYLAIRMRHIGPEGAEDRTPPMKELATVERWNAAHFAMCMSLYLFEVSRYVLVSLISLEAVYEYHYLDCFMFGRFRYAGRTNKIASSIELTFLVSFIVYRYIVFVVKPEFKFPVIEFMLYKREHVVETETKFKHGRRQLVARRRGDDQFASHSLAWSTTRPVDERGSHTTRFGPIKPNPVFYFRNQFHATSLDCKWILRPNRTSKSWTALSAYARLGFYTMVAIMISLIVLMSYTLAGPILTNLGYEMAYPTCVAYIQDKQQRAASGATTTTKTLADQLNATTTTTAGALPFSQTYLAPKKLAHQIRIEDIPFIIPPNLIDLQSINIYKGLRIFGDVVGNFVAYMECSFILLSGYFIVFICSMDIMINAQGIQKRLERLIRKLKVLHLKSRLSPPIVDPDWGFFHHERSNYAPNTLLATADRHRARLSFIHSNCMQSSRWCRDKIDSESMRVQAILADHFQMVHDYNKLVAFYFKLVMSVYITFSLVLFNWTMKVKSRAIVYEFIIGQQSAVLMVIVFLSAAAVARSCNFNLYKLVGQTMALETNFSSKLRWATLMDYYSPKPLYCFKVIGSVEISWLFCLKVSCAGCFDE